MSARPAPSSTFTATAPAEPLSLARLRLAVVLVTLTWAALFLLRMAAPDDLMDNDQERPASYIMDAVENGNWIVQRDIAGSITSKPPLYTWLGAVATLAIGRASLWGLYLPTGLATLATALMILLAGRRLLSLRAGAAAALMFLASPAGLKQLALSRTDTLFATLVFAAVLAAWGAWQRGRGWELFWLLTAALTLTKGPLGIVLALGGFALLLLPSERAALKEAGAPPTAPWRGRGQWAGLGWFLLLTGGWFLAAWLVARQDLIDKMIGDELVGHAVHGDAGQPPLVGFYKPPAYFAARFAPWSLLTLLGLWQAWLRPAADAQKRRALRYFAAQVVVGTGIFSLAPHQRGDHLLPMMPAAALLAGASLDALLSAAQPPEGLGWLSRPRRAATWVALWLVALGLLLGPLGWYLFKVRVEDKGVRHSREVAEFAAQIRTAAGEGLPLLFVADTPYALQFHLNTMQPRVSASRAARALSGALPVYVATIKLDDLYEELEEDRQRVQVLLAWPAERPWIYLVSNQKRLELPASMMTADGPLWIELYHMHLERAASGRLHVTPASDGAATTAALPSVLVRNESSRPQPLALQATGGGPALPWTELKARTTRRFTLVDQHWMENLPPLPVQ